MECQIFIWWGILPSPMTTGFRQTVPLPNLSLASDRPSDASLQWEYAGSNKGLLEATPLRPAHEVWGLASWSSSRASPWLLSRAFVWASGWTHTKTPPGCPPSTAPRALQALTARLYGQGQVDIFKDKDRRRAQAQGRGFLGSCPESRDSRGKQDRHRADARGDTAKGPDAH